MTNILLIVLGLIMIWRIVSGAKHGMVKELFGLINVLFVSFVLTLAFMIYRGYKAGDLLSLVPYGAAIIALSIAYAIIKLIFSPAKLVVKLPLVKSVDKILGVVMGAAEVFIVFWVLCSVLEYTNIPILEEKVVPFITANPVLVALSQNNLLEKLVQMLTIKLQEQINNIK